VECKVGKRAGGTAGDYASSVATDISGMFI